MNGPRVFQVEVGKCYEMVITTADGLTRYRVGDVIQISGYYYETPDYTFEYR